MLGFLWQLHLSQQGSPSMQFLSAHLLRHSMPQFLQPHLQGTSQPIIKIVKISIILLINIFIHLENIKMKKYDQNHWIGRSPPFSPNEYEIELYRHYTKGYSPICLLGMTKELQPLCDFMVDNDPSPQEKPVRNMDWNDYSENVEVIIADGVLNLEGIQLVDKLISYCKKLVCRVFLKKFEWMKYAKHFPNEFPNASLIIPTQKDIAMVIWEK